MLKDVRPVGELHRSRTGRIIRRGWLPGVLTAALAVWPGLPAAAQAAQDRIEPSVADDVDRAVNPGDDFFAYANGGWLARTEIPAGLDRWNARTEIEALTGRQVARLLDAAAEQPPGSLARKVADFQAAYLAEDRIEAKGLAPVASQLDSIDQVRTKAGLARLLGHWLPADVDPLNWGVYQSSHLLGLSVEPGIHGESHHVAFLLQGGLGLPDQQAYLGADPAMRAMRASYQAYIGRQLALAAYDHPDQRARAVLMLEIAIARTHATPEASASDRNAGNLWAQADFARRAPGMDWSAFFVGAGLTAQDTFVAWQPTAVVGAAAVVASQPLHAWKDYLRVRVLDRYADALPRAFAEASVAWHDSVAHRREPVSRRDRARQATESAMRGAIGRLYAERYFPADRKARVERIVANVRDAFARRVGSADWLSPGSRALALEKLKTLYFGVGYPEQWEDFSDLVVDSTDPVGNLRRIAAREYGRALARLGQPVDRQQWWISPQTVGAVLVFQQNAYNFPAALLQGPKFEPAASDAANYGAIGAIVGHEISHFVDVLGADWDVDGRARHWWTPADSVGFQRRAEALVRQFSGYRPFPDLTVDGGRTRTENVADLAGLAAAFDAYRRSLGATTDADSVRRHDREFFIGFARSWRSRLRDEALRAQVSGDSHAPERYRIATVRNIDAWYEAFDVRPGQRLYLEPSARVRIW